MAGINIDILEQANKEACVINLQDVTGDVRERLDVDVLLKTYPDTFNLYILALAAMQQDDSITSYDSFASIHGYPYQNWNNIKGRAKTGQDIGGGYCVHSDVKFATWHRPYLAFLEQTIFLRMYQIANTYSGPAKTKYLQALTDFRLPYWDYYRPRDLNADFGNSLPQGVGKKLPPGLKYDLRMPDIMNVEHVVVRTAPNDELASLINPLYAYVFRTDAERKAMKGPHTFRRGGDKDSPVTNIPDLNGTLNYNVRSNVNYLLNLGDETFANYYYFATNARPKGNPNPAASLEDLHGKYHGLIGGAHGQMTYLNYSAFDPVFWLHHCNIDRYLAVYQAFRPNSWYNKGDPEETASLFPWYSAVGGSQPKDFFNSDSARALATFGYSYSDVDVKLPPQDIWKNFANNYSWITQTPKSPTFDDPPPAMAPLDLNSCQAFAYSSVGKGKPVPAAATNETSATSGIAAPISELKVRSNSTNDHALSPAAVVANIVQQPVQDSFDRQWQVELVVERNAYNGTFGIYFFLGPKDQFVDDPLTYSRNAQLAGFAHIGVTPAESCGNCAQQAEDRTLVGSYVPLTAVLLDRIAAGPDIYGPGTGLENMRAEHVDPFLKKYLRWRVVVGADDKQDPRNTPGLNMVVTARLSHDDAPPTLERYPDIIQDIISHSN